MLRICRGSLQTTQTRIDDEHANQFLCALEKNEPWSLQWHVSKAKANIKSDTLHFRHYQRRKADTYKFLCDARSHAIFTHDKSNEMLTRSIPTPSCVFLIIIEQQAGIPDPCCEWKFLHNESCYCFLSACASQKFRRTSNAPNLVAILKGTDFAHVEWAH